MSDSGNNRDTKRDLFHMNDDNSAKEQPVEETEKEEEVRSLEEMMKKMKTEIVEEVPSLEAVEKTVKEEPEEFASLEDIIQSTKDDSAEGPSISVVELQKKLARSDKRNEVAGFSQAQIAVMEKLIDLNSGVPGHAKNVVELTMKLDQERATAAAAEKKAAESAARAAEFEIELEKERKERSEEREKAKQMIASLMLQLDQERATAAAAVKKSEDSAALSVVFYRDLEKERKERSEERETATEMLESIKEARSAAVAAEKKLVESAARAARLDRDLQKEHKDRREDMEKAEKKVNDIAAELADERAKVKFVTTTMYQTIAQSVCGSLFEALVAALPSNQHVPVLAALKGYINSNWYVDIEGESNTTMEEEKAGDSEEGKEDKEKS